jgi:hypothetical protein
MRASSDPGAKPPPEGSEPKPVPPRPSPDTDGANGPPAEQAPDKEPNRFLILLLRALSAIHT